MAHPQAFELCRRADWQGGKPGVAAIPSNAFTQHFFELLGDADELLNAHRQLRAPLRGRQWGRGSLNRAVVVMCASAWEANVEQVVAEAVAALQPPAGRPLGSWPGLHAATAAAIRRWHTPSVDNVRNLILHSIGLPDVTTSWSWRRCTVDQARRRLARALELRHQIAHGVLPRPRVRTRYVTDLIPFFRRLGRKTDAAIRDWLVNQLGVAAPWPP